MSNSSNAVFDWSAHRTSGVQCRIKVRPAFRGSPALPCFLEKNGTELTLVAVWLMDEDDKYPGEWALSTDSTCRGLYESIGISWIASGDVEVMVPGSAHTIL